MQHIHLQYIFVTKWTFNKDTAPSSQQIDKFLRSTIFYFFFIHCTEKTLEERFNCADVVLTGTIVKLNLGGKSNNNSTVVGGPEYVKVWTIIKPNDLNLKEFIDRDLQRKVKRIRSK